ncbi:MAG: hypothetical protein JRD68_14165 [Deltaproteobacteria bacterium]|nr:hypothetical protein [Deltaproteobacteria bacterium]
MKDFQKIIEKIERLLIAAHGRQIEIPAGLGWQVRVMSQIHELGSSRDGVFGQTGMEKNIWRFAVATGLAALVMAVYVMNTGLIPEHEILRVFMDYPEEYVVSQSFGF